MQRSHARTSVFETFFCLVSRICGWFLAPVACRERAERRFGHAKGSKSVRFSHGDLRLVTLKTWESSAAFSFFESCGSSTGVWHERRAQPEPANRQMQLLAGILGCY